MTCYAKIGVMIYQQVPGCNGPREEFATLTTHRRFLPSGNVVCEGYVFTPVCHSVHRGGGGVCLSACWDTHPLGRPTQVDPSRQTPPGQTPPWADTPRQTEHPPRQTPQDTQCPVHAGIDMATATDGMHPSGMHSC